MAMSSAAWSAVAAGISALIALFALFVARRQVDIGKQQVATGEQQVTIAQAQQEVASQQMRATAWSMITQLDATLREYRDEREWVSDQATKQAENQQSNKDDHDIAGYMGVFERLNELLGTGPDFVSEETAHAFYGPRIRLLLKTARARKILGDRPASWVSFISLSLKLDSYGRRNSRNPVIAVPGPDPKAGPEPDEAYRKELEAHLRDLAGAGDGHAKELLADAGRQ
jgi:hypothetical protein